MSATSTHPHASTPGEGLGPSRILVVDDQPSNIQVVGHALGKLGHDIIPASDGATALKRLGLRKVDLILLDVLMPDMDGYEICRRIRANADWNDVPIIFLSAADDKDFIVRALEAGGVDYITKPFNQAELVSRVRTHLALKATRDRLAILAEDKDELLGILAHDCKNQLGGLHMSAQLLTDIAKSLEHPRLQQLAENMEHNSAELLGFMREFLANASVEHSLDLNLQPLCLQEIVALVARQYRAKAERKELTLHLNLPASSPPVQADKKALQQVLDNLLSNAIKFSPPNTSISVEVRSQDDLILCVVADQGPGFSDEDKKRMFQRYARLSARPTAGEASTGLGLSIVKKLVESMHGTLHCESAPGQGATFTIAFPPASDNSHAPLRQPRNEPANRLLPTPNPNA